MNFIPRVRGGRAFLASAISFTSLLSGTITLTPYLEHSVSPPGARKTRAFSCPNSPHPARQMVSDKTDNRQHGARRAHVRRLYTRGTASPYHWTILTRRISTTLRESHVAGQLGDTRACSCSTKYAATDSGGSSGSTLKQRDRLGEHISQRYQSFIANSPHAWPWRLCKPLPTRLAYCA